MMNRDIQDALRLMNEGRKRASQNMRLGAFIEALEKRPQDQRISFDFCGLSPEKLQSYRGFYDDLALPFDVAYPSVKVSDMLANARAAIGRTFEGYKGGDYLMDADTLLWVSPYGESHSTAVVGVTGNDYETIIETAWMPS